ncbi:nitroreductase [Mycobacterium sp. CPCC 205372]|uniref:Nitroreductase n=1 Tax=Mycobacterium hippophais TaxID=3016340 RepID=A0ABT4PTH9_9MYCO|nr:nitroreductase [Mycobacterium hippophais]MCZ8379828.1 nitroreductase [Mycobacterium hippophais]
MSSTTVLTESVDRVIRSRRATRAFRSDEVPPDTMRAVFELAGHAPSNSNTQPWRVEVVSGAARDRLADALVAAHAAGEQSVDFPYRDGLFDGDLATRRAQFGAQLYAALGIARDDTDLLDGYNTRSLRFYGAPHVAMLFAPAQTEARIAADMGIYAQTLLLAMAAHGIASCPQALLTFYADTVRAQLGVTDRKLLLGISFGYADDSAPVNTVRVPRAALVETTRFHR